MTTPAHLDVSRRHDFVLLFDVTGGNPNGDPDNGNAPRMDPITGHGWVTDVALKRKVRNFVAEAYGTRENGDKRFEIYVAEHVALNARHDEASKELDLKPNKKRPAAEQELAAAVLARRFYDVRTFGAVMSTGDNPAGQVRGAVQISCPITSVDPIEPNDLTITRVAVTRTQDLEKMATGEGGKDREMGSKITIPYALFRAYGFVTPSLAEKTGFDDGDLEVFWDALSRMWALDRSSSRGMTGLRGLHIFTHADKFGRGHPDDLFQRIAIERRIEGPARSFPDYDISINIDGLEKLGVSHTSLT